MSCDPTVRKRIIDLLVERLRDTVRGTQLYSTGDNEERQGACDVSGEYTGDFPVKFEITVLDSSTVRIKETTLWREYQSAHPTPYDVTVPYVVGTPIEIDDTGVSIAFDGTEIVGDGWLIRMHTSCETIQYVYPYYNSPEDTGLPSLAVWPGIESSDPAVNDLSVNRLPLVLDLEIDSQSRAFGELESLIGNIKDEINRDHSLYDNTECLAVDCYWDSTELYDSDASPSAIGVIIKIAIQYRTQFNNSRLKK